MAKRVTIELDHGGIRAILESAEVASECKRAAEGIAQRAGEGFEVVGPQALGYGGGRVGYGVRASNYEAMKAESENKALSKAVR